MLENSPMNTSLVSRMAVKKYLKVRNSKVSAIVLTVKYHAHSRCTLLFLLPTKRPFHNNRSVIYKVLPSLNILVFHKNLYLKNIS